MTRHDPAAWAVDAARRLVARLTNERCAHHNPAAPAFCEPCELHEIARAIERGPAVEAEKAAS